MRVLGGMHVKKRRVRRPQHVWPTEIAIATALINSSERLCVARSGAIRVFADYGAEIIGGDSCPACKRIQGKKYKLNSVPELPYEGCTAEGGCCCTVVPVVD